ncbi:MAG: M48 family metallopeptidase [Alphaproteobacteria bacterium]|nr:M48 family metallopeptidase [Alphaproteobacteria bacterium]
MRKTVYDHIRSNNQRTAFLVAMFPISLLATFFVVLYALLYVNAASPMEEAFVLDTTLYYMKHFAWIVIVTGLAWMGISWLFGDKMMLGFAGAEELKKNKKENKAIYNLVENTALAAGLPCPKVFVIDDESLNAFATGRDPKSASVALTTGIIQKLEPLELQGVIAHEMAHIGNRDIRLNMLLISGVSIFGFLAEILFRAGAASSHGENKSPLPIVLFATGITFFIFNLLIAPLLQMAVSRTREYAADATGALITRHPEALANALSKITKDARVEALDSSKKMAIACIHTPLSAEAVSLFSTHPPVEERIKRLKQMAGTGL